MNNETSAGINQSLYEIVWKSTDARVEPFTVNAFQPDQTTGATISAGDGPVMETGWLIELPWTASGGGRLCWLALNDDKWPYFEVVNSKPDDEYDVRKHKSPFRFTPDSTEALRFARKQDAESFMVKFELFLLHPVATEHQWIGAP